MTRLGKATCGIGKSITPVILLQCDTVVLLSLSLSYTAVFGKNMRPRGRYTTVAPAYSTESERCWPRPSLRPGCRVRDRLQAHIIVGYADSWLLIRISMCRNSTSSAARGERASSLVSTVSAVAPSAAESQGSGRPGPRDSHARPPEGLEEVVRCTSTRSTPSDQALRRAAGVPRCRGMFTSPRASTKTGRDEWTPRLHV